MNNIHEILEFRFSKKSFSEKGETIVPQHVLNLSQSHISILQAITERLGNSPINPKPIRGIREVYLKVIRSCESGNSLSGKFNKRELRILCHALTFKENHTHSIFDNPNYLKQCITLLNENWRDAYIIGLLNCQLSKWGDLNKESFHTLSSFITNKISSYNGSRSLYKTLKINSKFFDINKGDIDLGVTLAVSNKSISDVTKFLSLPDHWISYPYFSGVINGFFEKSKNEIASKINDIADTLEKHSSSNKPTRTNQFIVSKIICHTINSNETLQNRVKDIAFKLVGDPGITSLWRPFEDASDPERITINKAREILNEWVTRQFINVFFEKCINDKRRKLFWLKFSKQITSFKVFGPGYVKRNLKSDERVTEYVDNRFKIVPTGGASAFMFELGNHRMIEFSIEGFAFYAFKKTNEYAPSFDSRVNSINDFTNGKMPMLVKIRGYSLGNYLDEGRLTHRDGDMKWEDVFYNWLKRKSSINV